jgi:hypothetical protein
MPQDPGPPDRRQHLRRPRPCAIACLATDGDDAGQWRDAQVVDVSPGGVGVLSGRRFESGAALKLRFDNGSGDTAMMSVVRVVRVQARPGGKWHLGCRFAPVLGDKEFGDVLKRTKRAGDVPSDQN